METQPREVSELFRHRDRQCLARATLGNPDRIARRFNSGWCVEPIFQYRDTCLVAIYGENRDLAAAILCEEELTVRCAHAIRPFYRLVDPDIDRCSRFARSIDGNAIKLVEDHIVHVEHSIEEGNAIDAPQSRMLQIKLRGGGASRQPKNSARVSVRNIERLVRSNREIVADVTVSWQVPADLRRAS